MLKNSLRNCTFTVSPTLVFFSQRKIEVVEPWAHHDIASRIAEGQRQVRCKNARVEPAVDVVCGPEFGSPLTFGRSFPRPVPLLS